MDGGKGNEAPGVGGTNLYHSRFGKKRNCALRVVRAADF